MFIQSSIFKILIRLSSEYIAQESNELFWSYVEDIVSEKAEYWENLQHVDLYNIIERKVGNLLSPLKLKLFKFAMSIRAHSPAVEMHNQVNIHVFLNFSNSFFINTF